MLRLIAVFRSPSHVEKSCKLSLGLFERSGNPYALEDVEMKTASNSRVLRTIPLLITICLFSFPIYAQYGGGTGKPNDPYLIYTAEQMNEIGLNEEDWDKHFKLMADIDLSTYTGIAFNISGTGSPSHPFTGVFGGNGHTISNFSYTSTDANDIGLFGYVVKSGKDAAITDLGLIDPNIDAGTGDHVGSLTGWLGEGTITNCYVVGGSVSGNSKVGGLVGSNGFGTITKCYVTASVTGGDYLTRLRTPWKKNSGSSNAGNLRKVISDCKRALK
jgi:hypothetical protein